MNIIPENLINNRKFNGEHSCLFGSFETLLTKRIEPLKS